MFRSATFKLTMYYLLIIAIISIGFSLALYHISSHDIASGLEQQTRRISDNFPVFSNSPYLQMGEELESARKHLVGRLVIFNLLVLVVAGFASYALARRTLRPIEAAHERQKRFTADVSHELRTPLTALQMESEVALLDPTASKTNLRQVITSNVEEAKKLTTLVSNLLHLSQLEAGEKADIQPSLPVDELVDTAIASVQSAANARDISMVYTRAPKLAVSGNQSTLVQLLVILLDNSIKYSSSHTKITVNSQPHGDSFVKISISDQGQGISKSDLEHVFERFYRADSARSSSEANGFGLGLSIAKLIADSNNATISLTSRVGEGTAAAVYLPSQPRSQMTKQRIKRQ